MMDSSTTTEALDEGHNLLLFRVGRIDCAVPVRAVESIIMPQPLTPLPKQGEEYLGVLQYREHPAPVLSLHRKFGMKQLPELDQGRFIMALVDGQITGFWVDEIIEIIGGEEYQWSDSPRFCPDHTFLRSLLWQNRIILFTDFERLLAMGESSALQHWLAETHALDEDDEDESGLSEACPRDEREQARDEGGLPPEAEPEESHAMAAARSPEEGLESPAGQPEADDEHARAETHIAMPQRIAPPVSKAGGEAIELSSFLNPSSRPLSGVLARQGGTDSTPSFQLLDETGNIEQPAMGGHVQDKPGTAYLGTGETTEPDGAEEAGQRPQAGNTTAGVMPGSAKSPSRLPPRRVSPPVAAAAASRQPRPSSSQGWPHKRFPARALTVLGLLLAVLLTQAGYMIAAKLEWQRLAQAASLQLWSERPAAAAGGEEQPQAQQATEAMPAVVAQPSPVTPVAPPFQQVPAPAWGVHVVVRGDTLWDLSAYYLDNPFRYPDLARWSHIPNPDLIYPDDKVIYPIQTRPSSIQPF